MSTLWSNNSPQNFWLCQPEIAVEVWRDAVLGTLLDLNLPLQSQDLDSFLSYSLGERRFGQDCWRLSLLKRAYYQIKPLLPCQLRYILRRIYKNFPDNSDQINWPVEDGYVRFQQEVIKRVLLSQNQASLTFRNFWPDDYRYAFILTHDIETDEGQSYVRNVIELEESFGFHSSFNFVPERYELDYKLMQEIRERGFEIGVHGLKHDGKLFDSYSKFMDRSLRINHYFSKFNSAGFRSPLMMRNPIWMQALEMDYDLSFFDTDPYEPIPGGVMSIWPFFIGHFVELPYTLPQDSTIFLVLCENTPQIWLQKVDFIEHNHGMALINTHPDYLRDGKLWNIYIDFLQKMKDRVGYWQPLPNQAAVWWRRRYEAGAEDDADLPLGVIRLNNDQISIESPKYNPGINQAKDMDRSLIMASRERV